MGVKKFCSRADEREKNFRAREFLRPREFLRILIDRVLMTTTTMRATLLTGNTSMDEDCALSEDERIIEAARLRKKIVRDSATSEDERQYKKLSGKDVSTVRKETPEKKKQRLSRERQRSAVRRQNETTKKRHRRLEAHRIRGKLRRTQWYTDNWEERKKLLDELYALPGYEDRGWKEETSHEWNRRLDKEIQRRKKRSIMQQLQEQLDPDLAVAQEMVSALSDWETYEETLTQILALYSSYSGGNSLKEGCNFNRKTFTGSFRKAQGIQFNIDFALSCFEKKHSLVPMKRHRPKWMVTPPGLHDSHEKTVCVRTMYYWYGLLKGKGRGWRIGSCREIVFEWDHGKEEWIPSPAQQYVFAENGFYISEPPEYPWIKPPKFGDAAGYYHFRSWLFPKPDYYKRPVWCLNEAQKYLRATDGF